MKVIKALITSSNAKILLGVTMNSKVTFNVYVTKHALNHLKGLIQLQGSLG